MESHEITFITWPNGQVDGGSLTVAGPRNAKERFLSQWLLPEWFGAAPSSYGVVEPLWRGATEKGFRCYTVKVDGRDGSVEIEQS